MARGEMAAQQCLLYAGKKHALLIVLQGMDATGKDGTVNRVMSAMNPQGTIVMSFREPTALDLEHQQGRATGTVQTEAR
jgi:polyphosphate kinase 2 (PPK2 family)